MRWECRRPAAEEGSASTQRGARSDALADGSLWPGRARTGWLHKARNEGLIQVVEDASTAVLVGATSVGPAGGEVLGLLTLAVHARVPVSQMQSMIYAYPTFHRGVEDVLRHLSPA